MRQRLFLLFCAFSFLGALSLEASSPFPLSFDHAMSQMIFYTPHTKQMSSWTILRKNYSYHRARFLKIRKLSKQPFIIPKIIHIVWLHDEEMSLERQRVINSWKKQHPKWIVAIWRKDTIDLFPMVRRDVYDAAGSLEEKSYIARYELLNYFGGMSIDPALECFQPFDLLHKAVSFYAPAWELRTGGISTAILGAAPRHPFIKMFLQSLTVADKPRNYVEIFEGVGSRVITKAFFEYAAKKPSLLKKSLIIPHDYIFSWPSWDRYISSRKAEKKWVKKRSKTMYHWELGE